MKFEKKAVVPPLPLLSRELPNPMQIANYTRVVLLDREKKKTKNNNYTPKVYNGEMLLNYNLMSIIRQNRMRLGFKSAHIQSRIGKKKKRKTLMAQYILHYRKNKTKGKFFYHSNFLCVLFYLLIIKINKITVFINNLKKKDCS